MEKSSVKLTLTFAKEAVAESYKASLNKYAKQLTIDGFRKGKAPASVIEKKYGETILNESFSELLDKAVGEIFTPEDETKKPAKEFQPIDSRNLDLLNEDTLFPIKKDEDVECQIKYDVYPEVELPQYKDLEIEYSADEYDPKVEEAEIEAIRNRNAMLKTKTDAAEVGDTATLDFEELDEDGFPIEGSEKEGYAFTIASEPAAPYEFDNEIVGMKTDEVKTFTIEYSENSAYPGEKKTYKATLTKLSVRILPELDDDFAQDVSEKYETLEDMKKDIHEKSYKDYEKRLTNLQIESLLDKLVATSNIDVPQTMIDASVEEKWYGFVEQFTQGQSISFEMATKRLADAGITKENYIRSMGERFGEENEKNIKKSLILEKVMEVENTTATEDEIKAFIEENKIDTKQYGEAYESYVMAQLKDQVSKDKALKLLEESNKFVKVEPKEEVKEEETK